MPRKSALAIAGEKIESLQNETESLKLRIKNYEELEAKHNLQEKLLEARAFLETYNTSDTAALLIGEKEDEGLVFQYAGNSLMAMYGFYALIQERFGVSKEKLEKISKDMKKAEADLNNKNNDYVYMPDVDGYRWLDLYSAMHKWNPNVSEKSGTYLIPSMLDFEQTMATLYPWKYYYLVCVVDRTEYPDWKKFNTMDIDTREKNITHALDVYIIDYNHYKKEAVKEHGATKEARLQTVSRAMACFAKYAYLPTSMSEETRTLYYNDADILGVSGVMSLLRWIAKFGTSVTPRWANVYKMTCRQFNLYRKKYLLTEKNGYIKVPFITLYPGLGWSYETKHMIETFWPGYEPDEEY